MVRQAVVLVAYGGSLPMRAASANCFFAFASVADIREWGGASLADLGRAKPQKSALPRPAGARPPVWRAHPGADTTFHHWRHRFFRFLMCHTARTDPPPHGSRAMIYLATESRTLRWP
jgi:hypothetical protein